MNSNNEQTDTELAKAELENSTPQNMKSIHFASPQTADIFTQSFGHLLNDISQNNPKLSDYLAKILLKVAQSNTPTIVARITDENECSKAYNIISNANIPPRRFNRGSAFSIPSVNSKYPVSFLCWDNEIHATSQDLPGGVAIAHELKHLELCDIRCPVDELQPLQGWGTKMEKRIVEAVDNSIYEVKGKALRTTHTDGLESPRYRSLIFNSSAPSDISYKNIRSLLEKSNVASEDWQSPVRLKPAFHAPTNRASDMLQGPTPWLLGILAACCVVYTCKPRMVTNVLRSACKSVGSMMTGNQEIEDIERGVTLSRDPQSGTPYPDRSSLVSPSR